MIEKDDTTGKELDRLAERMCGLVPKETTPKHAPQPMDDRARRAVVGWCLIMLVFYAGLYLAIGS